MSERYSPTSNSSIIQVPEGEISIPMGEGPAVTTSMLRYDSPITEQVRAIIPKIADRQIALRTEEIARAIDETVYFFSATGGEVATFPPARSTILDDGSVSIEWISRDFRFGFNIDADPAASGWYLATSKRLGETGAYGFLSDTNMRSLVAQMIRFIRANS